MLELEKPTASEENINMVPTFKFLYHGHRIKQGTLISKPASRYKRGDKLYILTIMNEGQNCIIAALLHERNSVGYLLGC